jgi:ATPase subunit of ABC transporter with duplicated ATPase domains
VCNKIVDSDRGVATTYKGNYTDFVRQKEEAIAQQWTAFEKWSKEVAKQKDIIRR